MSDLSYKNRIKNKIKIFDSTLRDGAQGEGISFSVEDKLNIVKALDDLGIDYAEAGNPGSNPKDLEFFSRVKALNLKNIKLTAFGSTRRRDIKVEDDSNVAALLKADTQAVAIFGKSWDFHVTDIIRTTLDENLKMIYETIEFFVKHGKEVIFDAEHFFDGYKKNPDYALKAILTAESAGASCICLCDTNGGCFPDEISEIVDKIRNEIKSELGIHCHNDMECAVANSFAAVKSGVFHIQGTYIGFGERCGNTNLAAVIPSLQLKRGYECIPDELIAKLTKTARKIAEISNIAIKRDMAYVGKSAFAHKGGMHVDGVNKNSASFEHIAPELVGNKRNVLLSEVSGRTAILNTLNRIDESLNKESPETQELINILKNLEFEGYQYEAANASLELVVLKHLKRFRPLFALESFRVMGEGDKYSSAMVKVKAGDEYEITADEGDGPVDALNNAVRKAVTKFFPSVRKVRLIDYKVRVLDAKAATAAKVRVLIESTDGENTWTTVGVSTDIIDASLKALMDSIEYKLLADNNYEDRF